MHLTNTAAQPHRRIAAYVRVSTEDQRDCATIRTQEEAIERELSVRDDAQLLELFADDGVSGMLPFAERPSGAALLAAAREGLVDEVWVYRYDCLARDEIESLRIRRELEKLGVTLYSVTEGYSGNLLYGIQAVMAAEERRVFLERSARGMERAAREGRYCGGIVSFGYRAERYKQTAHVIPADEVVPGCPFSAVDVVKLIFERLALEGRSCRVIADELNAMGIPTRYQIDGRGVRGKRVQGRWAAGAVRRIATNPLSRGCQSYGRRSAKPRQVITAPAPALVSEEMWRQAQETLARNRNVAKNTSHVYLLRGVMKCASCGRTFCGTQSHGETWYRGDGTLHRAKLAGDRCFAKVVKGVYLEEPVWADIERLLRDPGDLIDELATEMTENPAREAMEKERERWQAALTEWQTRRARVLDAWEMGHMTREEFDERLARVEEGRAAAEARLAELVVDEEDEPEPLAPDLLAEIRRRLDEGLTDEERAEIVRLLVKRITVFTNIEEDGKKLQRALVEYRFICPSATDTDRGS